MKNLTKALAFLAIIVASLTLSQQAASAAEDPATVRVTNQGDLVVRVHSSDIDIEINGNGIGNYAVWITDSNGQLHVQNVFGANRHARIEIADFEDVNIEFGRLAPTTIPGDLRISTAGHALPGRMSFFRGYDLTIGDDVKVKGHVQPFFVNTTVADDFLIYPQGGPVHAIVERVTVGDRFYVRRNNTGAVLVRLADVAAASTSISGSPFEDSVSIFRSDLGSAPRILLQGANDEVGLDGAVWSQNFFFRGGDGHETFVASNLAGNSLFDVAMEDGDDYVCIRSALNSAGAGSRFNGGSGFDQIDCDGADISGARVVKFEVVPA